MSLVAQQPFAAPGLYFTALQNAVSGGGGGGGSVSSIVNGGSSVVCDPSGVIMSATDYITGAALGINLNNTWFTNPANVSTSQVTTNSISSLAITASNFAATAFVDAPAVSGSLRLQAYSGASNGAELLYLSSGINTTSLQIYNTGVVTSALSVSSLSGIGGLGVTLGTDLNVDSNYQVLGGGSNANTGASINNFQTIGCGTLETTAINASYGATEIDFGAAIKTNNISTLFISTGSVTASTINQLVPIGTFAGSDDIDAIQAGFVSQMPYGSTILFNKPYLTDKISVMVMPTDRGVSGGANPNTSLVNSWGVNGVSSIGFAADIRNGGVGFQADFFWMAFPWTN